MNSSCFVRGYVAQFGNNVSNANNKTSKKFKPNIHKKRLWLSDSYPMIKVNITPCGLRTLEKFGGLMEFLMKSKHLTTEASLLKKRILSNIKKRNSSVSTSV